MVTSESNADEITITLMPNRSATMRQTNMIIAGVSLFVLIIAIGWGLAGAAFVLPFAGIDVLLFAYFMHKVCYQTYEKQVITIDESNVLFQSGKQSVEHSIKLHRPSTYLSISEPKSPRDPTVLNLTDSDERIELGAFLTHEDKAEARSVFKQAGLREVNEQWWKN